MPVIALGASNPGMPMSAHLGPGAGPSQGGSSTNPPHHANIHAHHTHQNFSSNGPHGHAHHPPPFLTPSQARKQGRQAIERRIANTEAQLQATRKQIEKMKNAMLDMGEKLVELDKACGQR
ncbi:hypothetical protein SPI_03637 [Niveomyces insectorum RCEF 264]|uniref:Uncharacterized protein n=1 Tax=Niveomyces insectorum RCEF 264 TaxID=1081102 RepID=A0A167W8N8_9HYPO|nr:hypothetical protein SPI_03637 [Niveomyces insectorum RCEF 264]